MHRPPDESSLSPGSAQQARINRLALGGMALRGLIHGLNNRLQTITAIVELLQRRPDVPEPARGSLAKIESIAQMATDTVREFTADYVAPPAGPGPVDLRALCDRAAASRAPEWRRAGIAYVMEPEAATPCVVRASAGALQQAVLNLLVNAEQALEGRHGGEIRVAVESGEGVVRLAVRDNGPGVDPAIRERIFEPFFTTRDPERALGLGLSVSAEIARRHGGALRYEPTEQGACFLLCLPVRV